MSSGCSLAEHYNVVVSPHFLPSLFIHVAGAAPSIRWMEDFPLLEPLFDKPVGIDSDGNITPELGYGILGDGAGEFQTAK